MKLAFKKLSKSPQVIALDLLADVASGCLIAMGILCFIAPAHIAPGGVSGSSILINYLTGLPIGTLTLLLNLPIQLLGWRVLGGALTLRTLRTLAFSTIATDYLFASMPVYSGDRMLAAIFGGLMIGLAQGLVFTRGSTTGGFDILVKIIVAKLPFLSMGMAILATDTIVLIASAVVYGNLEAMLYGLVTIFVSSRVVNLLVYGPDEGRCALIVSKESAPIADWILDNLHRGVTLLPAKGAFTGQPNEMLLCVVPKREFYLLKNAVHVIDARAFVIVMPATEVLGQGFKSI